MVNSKLLYLSKIQYTKAVRQLVAVAWSESMTIIAHRLMGYSVLLTPDQSN